MSERLEMTVKFHVGTGPTGHKEIRGGDAPAPVPAGRIPRVSKMMALALRFEQLIRSGIVANQAEIARLGFVSRVRVTQIMNLLNLAPDIQEEILFLPRIARGRDLIREKDLRAIAAEADWEQQRENWHRWRSDRKGGGAD